MPEIPECVRKWSAKINAWGSEHGLEMAPKVIIICRSDLEEYESYLVKYYREKGQYFVPVDKSGMLKFRGIEIGLSEDVKPNDCILMATR